MGIIWNAEDQRNSAAAVTKRFRTGFRSIYRTWLSWSAASPTWRS